MPYEIKPHKRIVERRDRLFRLIQLAIRLNRPVNEIYQFACELATIGLDYLSLIEE